MLPGEVKLTARMNGRPFALLGVNTDESVDKLRSVMKEHGITWRNFWADQASKDSLPRKWNIRGYPTMFLVDHKGVIRKKYLGVDEAEFERDVDALVAEAEAALKAK